MRVISINAGLPRTLLWKGREVTTGIFKTPVSGPVMLRKQNLDGDRQADLENHGGWAKAVYAYPAEHYEFWHKELGGADLTWGNFGENFTTEGLSEKDTHLGDQFRIGGAVVMATQPRIPCYKLGMRMGRDDIVKRFLESHRSGIYFTVLQEGWVQAGDTVERIKEDEDGISIQDLNRAYVHGSGYVPLVRRALRHSVLPSGMREHFLSQLPATEQT
jgi:MOSC domain-containing protein YiiM